MENTTQKKKDPQSRKWQLTINNPMEKEPALDHDKIKLILSQLKSCTYYCLADEVGLETKTPHTHIFLYCKSPAHFSRLKKLFPDAHIEQAHGTVAENRDYVAKAGKWADNPKADTSVPNTFEEEGTPPVEAGQGARSDLEAISEMLDAGMNPGEIMRSNFAYRKYERMIRSAYFDKRKQETPVKRDVSVHYIVGESGTGKSFTYTMLCDERGEDNIYFLSDYENGGLDLYCGEHILFMDEYKGQFRFSQLLIITDCYKSQVHARYANVVALWDEIYITSVFPPEELYKKMVEENDRGIDKQRQLFRRITDITYCFIDHAGEYKKYTIPMEKYVDYDDLKHQAENAFLPAWVKEAENATEIEQLPF